MSRASDVADTPRVPLFFAHGSFTTSRWSHGKGNVYSQRRGVTLIELLVVIFIMLLITAITIPVIAPAIGNRDVREAARMLDVFINGAKSRAKLTGGIYGVILEREPGNPNACVMLSYCEQPDPYTGDYSASATLPGQPASGKGSTICLLGNGGFGEWPDNSGASPTPGTPLSAITFPSNDQGWLVGPAPLGGYLTTFAPGDLFNVNGVQYKLWAGEPFLDIDQDGVCGTTAGFSPNTPIGVLEPFIDVDGNGQWTGPNPAPGQPGNVSGQPYVDPASGYFASPTTSSPFPAIVWGQPSAFITYSNADTLQASVDISTAFKATMQSLAVGGGVPRNSYFPSNSSFVSGATITPTFAFSFLRRPVKTSAPSIQLPGGSVIDLGANYIYPTNPQPMVVPIPGSGVEVLVSNANAYGWWSTFRANPALDPMVPGSLAQTNPAMTDTTSIMFTFQPNGSLYRIYSWSEANDTNTTISVANWSDWQGRIPAGPIYLLVGRAELVNGDPTLLNTIAANQAPKKPIFNVQDPTTLWVTITQHGAVSTAENVGYDLSSTPLTGGITISSPNAYQSMATYWAANVYYSRRIARSMMDMGGR